MPKAKPSIEQMIAEADERAERELAGDDPAAPVLPDNGQPDTVAPGMMRIHIVSPDHTDGKYKKTWLRDSVIEIDEYTAKRMIENLKCAYPTTEPINEIIAPYKGK